MNGLHKLERYITVNILCFLWTNTLAYWTQLYIMPLWLLIFFVSIIVLLDSEYSIEETLCACMVKCVLAYGQNAFWNWTCKWSLSGNLCSWQERQSNLPRALRKLTKKWKQKLKISQNFYLIFAEKLFSFFLPSS